jgi:fumarylacetoacetase
VNAVDRWPPVPEGSPFGMANLPFGVFSQPEPGARGGFRRIGVAVGDQVLDLAPLFGDDCFAAPTLDAFLARGRRVWSETRARITELLTDAHYQGAVSPHLLPRSEVALHLPFTVADYADFYCSLDHASNVGRIFRPDAEPLLPNWRHLPVGYHGRAGTVVVSGTPIVRPSGQRRPPGAEAPTYGPSVRLDIEAEVGFVLGVGSSARSSGSRSPPRSRPGSCRWRRWPPPGWTGRPRIRRRSRTYNGSTRSFLEDGDTVTISATAPAADGGLLSLGEVTGTIHAARTSV